MRSSSLATAVVALTISLTYLAATFVDCERPSLLPSRSVGERNEVPHHAGASHHAAGAPTTHESGYGTTAPAAVQSPAWAGLSIELEWVATCLCGCGETRSLAANTGGGALGAVAFGDEAMAMLTAVPLRPVNFYAAPDRLLDLPRDPIPI